MEILGTSSEPPAASRLNVVSCGSGAPGNTLMKKLSIVIVDDGRSDEIKKNLQA